MVPVRRSHSLTVLSYDPLASTPADTMHREYTVLECPVKVRVVAPVRRSHSLTVSSLDPLASTPADTMHRDRTEPECPVRTNSFDSV